jgi:peptidoglycan/LPS O-acetylase OafA/YrhL
MPESNEFKPLHGGPGKYKELPSVDGWRALSIALLLLGHCVFTPYFPTSLNVVRAGGIMGVRFFFVISGFLITWLLLREREKSGSIHLGFFYIRRLLRIFPVVYVYLIVLGLLTAYHQSASAWIANLTFTTNYVPVGFPTSHLWSLAVEEQFYLLWPVLLWLMPPAKGWGYPALFLPAIIAPLARSLSSVKWLPPNFPDFFGYWSFFSEFDLLAYGCLAAFLFTRHRILLEAFYRRHPFFISFGAVGMIFMSAIFHPYLLGFYESFQGLGFATLLLQSIMFPDLMIFRPLQWSWVRQIGVLSYSIYIWQMMFCGTDISVFGVPGAWWVTFPAWILLSLLAAVASYHLLEKPLFRLRARFRI